MRLVLLSLLVTVPIGLGCTGAKNDTGKADYELRAADDQGAAPLPEEDTALLPEEEEEDHHGDDGLPDDFDPATEKTTPSGITVSYTTDPRTIAESETFSVTFTLSAGVLSDADATMPTHGGHGMAFVPGVNYNGDNTYTATPFVFHMPGYWVIHATIVNEDGDTERLNFDVDCCDVR